MDKGILQKILLELTKILEHNEWVESMPAYDKTKTSKQNTRALNTACNQVNKKYKAIEDLINKL